MSIKEEKGFASGDLELQKQALNSAGYIGEKGMPLLEKASKNKNKNIQKYAKKLLK